MLRFFVSHKGWSYGVGVDRIGYAACMIECDRTKMECVFCERSVVGLHARSTCAGGSGSNLDVRPARAQSSRLQFEKS